MRALPLLGMPKPQQIKRKQTTIKGIPETKQKKQTMKTFTCPMHPEVKSDQPGKCPKCGMELTQKDGSHNNNILAMPGLTKT